VRAPRRTLRPGWVAGSVRARLLLDRALGLEQARALAASPSLDRALGLLAGSAYGRTRPAEAGLAAAERAIAETVLWHARVLAGWLPPDGAGLVRTLAAWFELANVEDRLAYLGGGPSRAPFALGGLAAAGTGPEQAIGVAELRAALASSPWGDPGSDDPAAIRLALRIAWTRRALATVPEAATWALGAVGLLLARELLLAGRSAEQLAALQPPLPSTAWDVATTVATLREALPEAAGWPLAGLAGPNDLWRGEVAWRRRVEQEAGRLARGPELGRGTVVGAIALMALDGWRAAAALQSAARGGTPAAIEVFDAVAG
jgi:hypothetical protein